MTTPRSPEGEMVDIMDLDREIEALRLGTGRGTDSSLSLLADLRDDVDRRAATVIGESRYDDVASEQPVEATAARRRSQLRLAVVPMAGALVLASTGVAAALSGSPHAPLYPLHRLFFGAVASSADQVSHDLAEARILLAHAAAQPYAGRAGDLARVHTLLADAQRVLPGAGADRIRLSLELSAAQTRLAQLETPPVIAITPSPAPPSPPAGEEASPSLEAPGAESEPSGGALSGGESESSIEAPLAPPAASEAPETAPSTAPTSVTGWTNDRPAGNESEAPESPRASGTDN